MEGSLMELGKARACILRVGGTNCDLEVKVALEALGLKADVLHMNQLKSLSNYQLLVFPGGFSYGDYVRAGAIWGKEAFTRFGSQLQSFVEGGKLVMGICNGFQVLVESGLLPGDGTGGVPTAALANNTSAKYECRWIRLRVEGNRSPFTRHLREGTLLHIPIGHGEGRFLLPNRKALDDLLSGGQVVFRYAMPGGEPSEGKYPHNPNGSLHDIAGICNKEGNVMGMMPHPERAFFGWQQPGSIAKKKYYGDGKELFVGAINYIQNY
jgi:phosphoribosylformylglycinamidine synthase I